MRLALTFDDGPSEWTTAILDLLYAHNAKATFFMCGHAINPPDVLVTLIDAQHEIGNHTYSHPRLTDLNNADVRAELRGTSEVIRRATGHSPRLWRAPYLVTSPQIDLIAAELGMRHVGVDIDPLDWQADARTIADRVVSQAEDGQIVLLHDGIPPDGGSGTNTRQPTVDALTAILNLPAEFVTVSELWASTRAA